MADYVIIELVIDENESSSVTPNKVKVKIVKSFEGPYLDTNNNFGLYASEDLEILAFYFKD